MSLQWNDQQSVKVAKPREDITISVIKWSKTWGWSIQKNDDLPFLARGNSDTAKLAKEHAEKAWTSIAAGQGIVMPPTPYARR